MAFKDSREGSTLCRLEVSKAERITPNMVRVTVTGDDLARLPRHGYDQWFRLFLPREEGETSFELPDKFDIRGYLRYLRVPGPTRPHMRNYTVRELHDNGLDIDLVVHGDAGVATRWATRTRAGDRIALIDQGRGFDPKPGYDDYLLVADETGLPAVAGILRDLPRNARGDAYLEIPDEGDRQPTGAPEGVDVHWLVRARDQRPGAAVLAAVESWRRPEGPLHAYAVGERAVPTTVRRQLVAAGVPKSDIVFQGYWRLDR